MKFCYKCGAQLEDGDVFCTSCGTKTEAPASSPAPQNASNEFGGYKEPVRSKKTMIIIIAAIAAVVAIVASIFIIKSATSSTSSPEKVLDTLEEAFNKRDAKAFGEIVFPMHMREHMRKESPDELAEIMLRMGEIFEEMADYYDENFKVTIDVLGSSKLSGDDYRDLAEEYYLDYGIKIEDAVNVDCVLTLWYDGESEPETEEILFYKYKGEWFAETEF